MAQAEAFQVEPLAKPTEEDWAALPGDLAQERAWYADAPRFENDDDIAAALADGRLASIEENPYAKPVPSICNPEGGGTFPVLTPGALKVLLEFASRWQHELGAILPDTAKIRIAIASMTRTQLYQNQIVSRGSLAVIDSTHQTGNTFDADWSGYYLETEAEGIVPIVHPDRHTGAAEAYYRRFREAYGEYDPRVTETAHRVADLMQSEGVLNLVPEYAGTPNSCMHISVNPNFTEPLAT